MTLAAYNYDQYVLDPGPEGDESLEICAACEAENHKRCDSPVNCECRCGDRVRADVVYHYSTCYRFQSAPERETGYVDEGLYCEVCHGRCTWSEYFPFGMRD